MKMQEAYATVAETLEAEEYNSYYDFAYTNNPNKVVNFRAVQFIRFGILCNASHDSAFIEGDLFDSYQDAVASLLEYFDDMEEAEENDNKIVLVQGEDRLYENCTNWETAIDDWEVNWK